MNDEKGDDMEMDNIQHGRFATILDLNSFNLSSSKVREDIIKEAEVKQYVVALGNLALIELKVRNKFKHQPKQSKKQ